MSNKKDKTNHPVVMLIDDSEIDNFINQKMIEGCNFAEQIYIHTSSKSALEFLKNIEKAGEVSHVLLPKVIFLDINMPIMDGFQFIDEFDKMSKSLSKNCKIVLLTTSINPSDMERSKNCKYIIQYVNKPLTQEVLDTIKSNLI